MFLHNGVRQTEVVLLRIIFQPPTAFLTPSNVLNDRNVTYVWNHVDVYKPIAGLLVVGYLLLI